MSRPVLIVLAGLLALAAAFGLSQWSVHREEQATPADAPRPAAAAPKTAPAAEKTAPQAAEAPSFDVVRINPQGETVIAGRAAPKAEVSILDGGKEIGHVTADNRGEWVFVPQNPLPPGSRELSLKALNPDGSSRQTDAPVVLMVPDRQKDKGASLAVKINPDGSVDVLQGPVAATGAGAIAIAAVKYDDQERLAVSGTTTAKGTVQVYLDNRPVGRVQADDQGRWNLARKLAVRGGDHTVRADLLGPDGKVKGRAEAPFSASGALPTTGKIVVEAGASLWRIARKTYGTGFDYLTIYQANKGQIRDPDRIYPGQVFQVPVRQ